MASLRYRNILLLAKVEVTEGVDAAPVQSTDAIALANITGPTPQPNVISDPTMTGGLDMGEPIVGATPFELGFQVQLKGSGTVSIAPEISPLLKACSYTENIVTVLPAASVTDCTGGTTTTVTLDRSIQTTWPAGVGLASGMLGRVVELSGNPATTRLATIVDYQVAGSIVTITFGETMASPLSAATKIKALPGPLYTPTSGVVPSLTFYVYRDGILTKLFGCRGQASRTYTSGERATMDVTFRGFFGGETDIAVPSAPVFQSTRAPIWLNPTGIAPAESGCFNVNKKQVGVKTLSLSDGNNIITPDNPNQPEGLDPTTITVRDVKGTMNPMKTLVATSSIVADFKAGTARSIILRLGTVAGNRISCAIPQAIYTGDTPEDQGGVLGENVPFSAGGPANGRAFLMIGY